MIYNFPKMIFGLFSGWFLPKIRSGASDFWRREKLAHIGHLQWFEKYRTLVFCVHLVLRWNWFNCCSCTILAKLQKFFEQFRPVCWNLGQKQTNCKLTKTEHFKLTKSGHFWLEKLHQRYLSKNGLKQWLFGSLQIWSWRDAPNQKS